MLLTHCAVLATLCSSVQINAAIIPAYRNFPPIPYVSHRTHVMNHFIPQLKKFMTREKHYSLHKLYNSHLVTATPTNAQSEIRTFFKLTDGFYTLGSYTLFGFSENIEYFAYALWSQCKMDTVYLLIKDLDDVNTLNGLLTRYALHQYRYPLTIIVIETFKDQKLQTISLLEVNLKTKSAHSLYFLCGAIESRDDRVGGIVVPDSELICIKKSTELPESKRWEFLAGIPLKRLQHSRDKIRFSYEQYYQSHCRIFEMWFALMAIAEDTQQEIDIGGVLAKLDQVSSSSKQQNTLETISSLKKKRHYALQSMWVTITDKIHRMDDESNYRLRQLRHFKI